jgi:hypothetical protein
MSKDGTTSTNTIQSSPVASAQAPFLSDLFSQSSQLAQSDPTQFYPGEMLAPVSAQTPAAIDLQTQRALSGSPVTNAAQGYDTHLLNGDFLGAGNPYFQNMVGQIGQAIQPQIDSQFNQNGRYGSGASANAFADALAKQAGSLAYQNYGDTLKQMGSQAFNAPALANQDYQDISQLGSAGDMLRQLGQQYTNEDISRFYGTQQAPWQTLQQLSGLLGAPIPGLGSSNTTSPYFTNPLGQVLGGAGGTLALYNGAQQAGLLGGAASPASTAAAANLAALSAVPAGATASTAAEGALAFGAL